MRMTRSRILNVCTTLAMLALVGCGTAPTVTDTGTLSKTPRTSKPVIKAPSNAKPDSGLPALPPANSGRGGYYQDDGPGDAPPANLADVPDADVRNDPLLPYSNRPYVVFGKTYTPITGNQPFTQIGIGSWYGKKFHGQRTSSGEIYDMYKMTAAHPTLPIPSYARLTNLVSGAVVVVRINDRGPFHANRAIDVSYTAALKLGLLGKGSHELQIERILPDEVDRMLATRAGVSGTVSPRLQSQSSSRPESSSGLGGGPLLLTPSTTLSGEPLVLAPKAMPAAASSDAAALMLTDRAPADAETPASSAAKGGFYLQLGAYSRAENAEAVRGKLSGKGLNGLEVMQGGAVYRLFTGPFATRQEALQAAQGLPSALHLKPIVVQR
ncbi:septal ring lytic transglycosylase RlpA family protein [Duganella sp. BJB488]|uniref:septal ring lytic transglycosylase RlpA family protein n=1 Tax=unclassified Duganella TaxID=2636909 RepID=UPI000E35342B|nr:MULTISPECIES: septal ring lytic transglycosylase RlpA family protein [unclassified Duganella]RFP22732.1 septal ring lytic transglycosylase RlpA family protein [Duganella sp. BJB489]RFP25193.1 septal ring lytic transglycosylase RlpA family protein [Duganella sp. BJB488]RFP33731.1 septal ring lytic transglycosylase RlpA family protein [Duganella sp. BJB480]